MVRHGEAVRQVRLILSQLRKQAKCLLYIHKHTTGKCKEISFTSFTPSPSFTADLVPMPPNAWGGGSRGGGLTVSASRLRGASA